MDIGATVPLTTPETFKLGFLVSRCRARARAHAPPRRQLSTALALTCAPDPAGQPRLKRLIEGRCPGGRCDAGHAPCGAAARAEPSRPARRGQALPGDARPRPKGGVMAPANHGTFKSPVWSAAVASDAYGKRVSSPPQPPPHHAPPPISAPLPPPPPSPATGTTIARPVERQRLPVRHGPSGFLRGNDQMLLRLSIYPRLTADHFMSDSMRLMAEAESRLPKSFQ